MFGIALFGNIAVSQVLEETHDVHRSPRSPSSALAILCAILTGAVGAQAAQAAPLATSRWGTPQRRLRGPAPGRVGAASVLRSTRNYRT